MACLEASCGMEIRRAMPAESDSLAELWLRSRRASRSIPPTIHTDEEVHQWFEEVVLPNCEVWIATDNGEAIGLMVLDEESVDQLYVDPTETGRGIGGTLLEHAMRLHPTGLTLWTFQSNLDARRFYEAHGFVATATTQGDNEEHVLDVCYEWPPGG